MIDPPPARPPQAQTKLINRHRNSNGESINRTRNRSPTLPPYLGEVVGGVDGGGVRRDVLLREPVHALLELQKENYTSRSERGRESRVSQSLSAAAERGIRGSRRGAGLIS